MWRESLTDALVVFVVRRGEFPWRFGLVGIGGEYAAIIVEQRMAAAQALREILVYAVEIKGLVIVGLIGHGLPA